jgi:integrase
MPFMPNIRVRKETGLLYFDFQYLKVRCREQSLLEDSKPNRKKMQKVLDEILGKIKSHTFSYRDYFPSSKQLLAIELLENGSPPEPMPARTEPSFKTQTAPISALPAQVQASGPLFADFANQWYSEMEVGWKRSHRTTTRGVLDNSLIPQFGPRL